MRGHRPCEPYTVWCLDFGKHDDLTCAFSISMEFVEGKVQVRTNRVYREGGRMIYRYYGIGLIELQI